MGPPVTPSLTVIPMRTCPIVCNYYHGPLPPLGRRGPWPGWHEELTLIFLGIVG
jgi:hypothetical protein